VQIMGRICPFCKLKYCLNHGMPEVHGCGEDARKQAREDWLKEKKKPDGTVRTSAPQNPLTGERRDMLAHKLQKKIGTVGHQTKKPAAGRGRGGKKGK